jgi:hypothetical protein
MMVLADVEIIYTQDETFRSATANETCNALLLGLK